MNLKELQKLHRAIEKRVRAEIAWDRCLQDPRGQLDEHRKPCDAVHKTRAKVSNLLEAEHLRELKEAKDATYD